METLTGVEVPVNVQITGGADSLTIRPLQGLKENTSYTLKVEDVLDLGDVSDGDAPLRQFQDLTTTFVTGEAPVDVAREVAFTEAVQLDGFADGAGGFTSIEFGPDGKLYVATITGQIHRWDVNADGHDRQVVAGDVRRQVLPAVRADHAAGRDGGRGPARPSSHRLRPRGSGRDLESPTTGRSRARARRSTRPSSAARSRR